MSKFMSASASFTCTPYDTLKKKKKKLAIQHCSSTGLALNWKLDRYVYSAWTLSMRISTYVDVIATVGLITGKQYGYLRSRSRSEMYNLYVLLQQTRKSTWQKAMSIAS